MGDISVQTNAESELQLFDKIFSELVEDVINSPAVKATGTEQAVDWFRKENYGRHNAEKVAAVKSLYQDLELPKLYSEYEESSYQELMSLTEKTQSPVPSFVFTEFAQKIYKRQK